MENHIYSIAIENGTITVNYTENYLTVSSSKEVTINNMGILDDVIEAARNQVKLLVNGKEWAIICNSNHLNDEKTDRVFGMSIYDENNEKVYEHKTHSKRYCKAAIDALIYDFYDYLLTLAFPINEIADGIEAVYEDAFCEESDAPTIDFSEGGVEYLYNNVADTLGISYEDAEALDGKYDIVVLIIDKANAMLRNAWAKAEAERQAAEVEPENTTTEATDEKCQYTDYLKENEFFGWVIEYAYDKSYWETEKQAIKYINEKFPEWEKDMAIGSLCLGIFENWKVVDGMDEESYVCTLRERINEVNAKAEPENTTTEAEADVKAIPDGINPTIKAIYKLNNDMPLTKEDVIVLFKKIQKECEQGFETLTLNNAESFCNYSAIATRFEMSTDEDRALSRNAIFINGIAGHIYDLFKSIYIDKASYTEEELDGSETEYFEPISHYLDAIAEARIYYKRLQEKVSDLRLFDYQEDGTPDHSSDLPF